jgi:hypothetical protein
MHHILLAMLTYPVNTGKQGYVAFSYSPLSPNLLTVLSMQKF